LSRDFDCFFEKCIDKTEKVGYNNNVGITGDGCFLLKTVKKITALVWKTLGGYLFLLLFALE
jgi:hypothetical protein